MSWNDVKLDQVILFKNGKKRPIGTGKFPVYGGNGILGYANSPNNRNCVIVGRVGAYCGSVYYEDGDCWVSDNAICALPKGENDIIFLYYLLKSLELNKRHIGTSQPLLTQEILNSIVCKIPAKDTQFKIGRLLRTLDEKIAVNQKINDNLQQQAQAIYSSMFIDNPNPAWKHGHLSDLITVKYGKDHKKLADGIYPVYGSGGIMRYAERPLYNKESVLIPRKGTLNNVIYVNQPFWSVDTMFYTEMKIPNVAKFVYHFVKAKDLASMNAGSAVPSMTTDILNAMEVVIPSAPDLEEFESLVAPMYKAMEANHVQSQVLSRMRDTLLPKLMSGEMDVSAVQL